MPEFSYHVSYLHNLSLMFHQFVNRSRRLTQSWSVIWLSATAFSPWTSWETCHLAAISFSTLFVTSWKSASWNTISVSVEPLIVAFVFLAQETLFRFLTVLICIPIRMWRKRYIWVHRNQLFLYFSVTNGFFYLTRTWNPPPTPFCLSKNSLLFDMTRLYVNIFYDFLSIERPPLPSNGMNSILHSAGMKNLHHHLKGRKEKYGNGTWDGRRVNAFDIFYSILLLTVLSAHLFPFHTTKRTLIVQ